MLDPMTIVILAVLAFIITYMAVSAMKSRQEPVKKKIIITQLKCANCDHSERREFKEGDYVGKETGKCPKCNGKLLVHAIYLEEIEGIPDFRSEVSMPKPKRLPNNRDQVRFKQL